MAKDINGIWESLNDNILIEDNAVFEQSVHNSLYLDQDDIYWGSGTEINISRFLFELMPEGMSSIRDLAFNINKFDPRLRLRQDLSSITPVGDQWQLNLTIVYDDSQIIYINELVRRT
jgi:hypothetical protein